MTFPSFELELDKQGAAVDPGAVAAAIAGFRQSGATDLFVFSHGWNNHKTEARDLYTRFFERVEAGLLPALAGRSFGVLAVLWPSKKFADRDLIPGGAASFGSATGDDDLIARLEAFKSEVERLGEEAVVPEREAALTEAQSLVADLEDDSAAQERFVALIRSVLLRGGGESEDGSDNLLTGDPQELLEALAQPVPPVVDSGAGGAAGFRGDDLEGGAAGLGDLLSGAKEGARRLLNATTYYQMKERAGLVGRTGVAEAVREIHRALPALRLHLVGHSFGGRVVTSAADALGPEVPLATLTLLQTAYSHNGLAEKFDGVHDGFFRKVLSERKVSGPILISHTKNDRAVGIAYPLASRLRRQNAASLGDENDPYGGMGRNGAQHTPEAVPGTLLPVGGAYDFQGGKVYNLRSDEFIGGHSDIAKDEVAFALLTAVVRAR